MTYVIGKECIDVQDKSCIDVCPVDCIYEGGRKTYINPTECIDCGACEARLPRGGDLPGTQGPRERGVGDVHAGQRGVLHRGASRA